MDLTKVFTSVNTSQTGSINYTEFLAATIEEKHYLTETKLIEAFSLFAPDKTNSITAKNLKQVLGQGVYYKNKPS